MLILTYLSWLEVDGWFPLSVSLTVFTSLHPSYRPSFCPFFCLFLFFLLVSVLPYLSLVLLFLLDSCSDCNSTNIAYFIKICEIYNKNYHSTYIRNSFLQGWINLESVIQTPVCNVKSMVFIMRLWVENYVYTSESSSTYHN